MKSAIPLICQFSIGIVFGAVIACSPTKFNPATSADSVCDSDVSSCVVEQGYVTLTQDFEIGAGKVDILFVNDNSASMSFEQRNMAAKFGGFVEALDQKKIDYQIAITTTDLAAVTQKKLITFGNGKTILTKNDSNRVGLFNSAIVREETIKCESFMKAMINTYGSSWRSATAYVNGYAQNCPSPDERGIFTSHLVLEENTDGFVRSDANLNVIAISDEDERSTGASLETKDKYDSLISMINEKYPTKYWEFNSIIVKDATCTATQSQQILDHQGQSAVGSIIGNEYAKLSMSAAKNIDNTPRPRGSVLDICQSDYSQHFNLIATQIAEATRMLNLKCAPTATPTVTYVGGASVPGNLYMWTSDKIVFQKGSEGKQITVNYKCYTGPK
jgi:hypothetical protein